MFSGDYSKLRPAVIHVLGDSPYQEAEPLGMKVLMQKSPWCSIWTHERSTKERVGYTATRD
jgi:hypothetical protein